VSAVRGAFVAAGVLLAVLALAVQLVADGLFGSLAVVPSLPHALAGDWPFALAARTGLDRIGAVRIALARGAVVRDEPDRAAALLAPLPAGAEVDDLRGRVALARHDPEGALREFAAAGDFIAASAAIDALAARDPLAALTIVRDFERRLAQRSASPEISAEVDWREGQVAAAAAYAYPRDALTYERAALAAYERALARAPNEEKYLLNAAFVALQLDQVGVARDAYARAAQVVPNSVDAFVGVAVTSAVGGDCSAARSALATARGFAREQRRTVDPLGAGYAPAVRAALARCG